MVSYEKKKENISEKLVVYTVAVEKCIKDRESVIGCTDTIGKNKITIEDGIIHFDYMDGVIINFFSKEFNEYRLSGVFVPEIKGNLVYWYLYDGEDGISYKNDEDFKGVKSLFDIVSFQSERFNCIGGIYNEE